MYPTQEHLCVFPWPHLSVTHCWNNSCRQHCNMHFVPTHFSVGLYVSEIITLKVANTPEVMNFLNCTYFKINLLPNSILLQHQ